MRLLLALLLLLPAVALAGNVSVTITVTPTSSQAPIAPTITWSSTGAGACTASGGWSGQKAISGTEVVAQVSKPTTYTLTCTSPTGPATLSWTAPTTNSDGSPVTLQGFAFFNGPSASALARNTAVAAANATSATIQAPPGLQFFTVRAVRAGDGIESVDSPAVSKTVVADSAAGSVTLNVAVLPNPPTNVTVQ